MLFGLIFFILVFMYVGIPFIYGRYSRILLGRKAAKVRTLVLTFDDGPGNRLTPIILRLLAEYNAKATFFLLGRNIAGREQIVRQIAADGHEICSHGYDHLHHWRVSPVRAIRDIKRGWQAIDNAIGTQDRTYPFRPPCGKVNLVSLLYLWAKKVPIIYWTVDSADTWLPEKRDPHRCASTVEAAGGGITLAHDFDRSTDKTDYYVLESLRLSLAAAKESGLQTCTVSQLIDTKR
jgi:peptidoglycan/xylan/chitin deacetylase (PgdA/CDA1 family)